MWTQGRVDRMRKQYVAKAKYYAELYEPIHSLYTDDVL